MVISARSTEKGKKTFGREPKEASGENKVKDEDIVLVSYASDASPVPGRKPAYVVLPESKEDVIATLKLANKYNIPVSVMAGGVSMAGYNLPSEGGIVMDMHRMDKII